MGKGHKSLIKTVAQSSSGGFFFCLLVGGVFWCLVLVVFFCLREKDYSRNQNMSVKYSIPEVSFR